MSLSLVVAMPRLLPPTEQEFIARLRRGEVGFPPLTLTLEEINPKGAKAAISMAWKKKRFRFAAEYKRLSNSKALSDVAGQAPDLAQTAGLLPLLITSYLDEPALQMLEAKSVSGIDLCGNGVVTVPGEWLIRRTGSPNLFQTEGVIKNVYRKSSSIVGRLFFARNEFESVQEALEEIRRRDGRVTLSTVSKVCKRLEEDLIIERKRKKITKLRLIQPEKLLDKLVANYAPPTITKRVIGKLYGIEPEEFRGQLNKWARTTGNLVSLRGTTSVTAYAVMAREPVEEYYCTDVTDALLALGDKFQPTERFAAITFLETRDEEVYFDRRQNLRSSPLQTFLELSVGDKRDQETASNVRKLILNQLSSSVNKQYQ